MNLGQLRADVATVANTAGFNSWSYVPDDPQDLPAAVVGGVLEMVRLNPTVTRLRLVVTFLANAANPEDATAVLDRVLSVGSPDSFLDVLDSVTAADGPAWRSVRFDSGGPYTTLSFENGGSALSVQVTLEFTA